MGDRGYSIQERWKMVMFQRGRNDALLNMIGVIYGYLLIGEGYRPFLVLNMAHAKSALDNAVAEGFISHDEAQELYKQACVEGVPPSWKELFEVISGVEPDEGVRHFFFRLCEEEGCIPLPHGRIVDLDGDFMTDPMHNLADALTTCMSIVEEGDIFPADAIHILQGALMADLPFTEEEAAGRYDALPVEERAAFERGLSTEAMIKIMAKRAVKEVMKEGEVVECRCEDCDCDKSHLN